jgi:hypothetical protein
MKLFTSLALLTALHLAAGACAAAETDPDMDARFRARLVKEKAKMNAEETNPALRPRDFNTSTPVGGECGSQSIGNISTNGWPGAVPRELFVFAPNAINIVNARGCN